MPRNTQGEDHMNTRNEEQEIRKQDHKDYPDYTLTGTPPDFRPEPFRPELPLASTTLRERFRAGFTLNTFADSCGRRVGGLVGDSGRLVEGKWVPHGDTHAHTQDTHAHTQDTHAHTQDTHAHTQDARAHA
ncbi:hypothetical protein M422DRAFT_248094 [Sphaerobolus stellatus SS14]|nr:hypothetical protein M422DRAFT_248094 [Sphaerobolus stellatus SS14]